MNVPYLSIWLLFLVARKCLIDDNSSLVQVVWRVFSFLPKPHSYQVNMVKPGWSHSRAHVPATHLIYVLPTSTEGRLCWGKLWKKRNLNQQMNSQHCISWANWVYIESIKKIELCTSHKIYTWSLKTQSFYDANFVNKFGIMTNLGFQWFCCALLCLV